MSKFQNRRLMKNGEFCKNEPAIFVDKAILTRLGKAAKKRLGKPYTRHLHTIADILCKVGDNLATYWDKERFDLTLDEALYLCPDLVEDRARKIADYIGCDFDSINNILKLGNPVNETPKLTPKQIRKKLKTQKNS